MSYRQPRFLLARFSRPAPAPRQRAGILPPDLGPRGPLLGPPRARALVGRGRGGRGPGRGAPPGPALGRQLVRAQLRLHRDLRLLQRRARGPRGAAAGCARGASGLPGTLPLGPRRGPDRAAAKSRRLAPPAGAAFRSRQCPAHAAAAGAQRRHGHQRSPRPGAAEALPHHRGHLQRGRAERSGRSGFAGHALGVQRRQGRAPRCQRRLPGARAQEGPLRRGRPRDAEVGDGFVAAVPERLRAAHAIDAKLLPGLLEGAVLAAPRSSSTGLVLLHASRRFFASGGVMKMVCV
mmetsp:Transcript_30328/g.100634  ORF Transcript_30328/g.100634 Transcript_30328/m.100634 type:complete len:292 (-) Transcript_30328:295-1170(-)